MRIALITPVMKSGEVGGAERLYAGLTDALAAGPHDVDRIDIEIDESTFEAVLDSYEAASRLDLGGYDAVISTKAPSFMVSHDAHISYFVHPLRSFYDRFEESPVTEDRLGQREQIWSLDRQGLSPARTRRHLAIGASAWAKLACDTHWGAVEAEILHPGPSIHGFIAPRPGEYFFLPGRLHRWKRIDLLIEAYRQVRAGVPLRIVGAGEDEPRLRLLARGDSRVEFLGKVTDEELLDLYAGAIAVPFIPSNEDFGFVAIEAAMAGKPVITCDDSGEPARLVDHANTGLVVDARPGALATALDRLATSPEEAAAMGLRAREDAARFRWGRVADRVLELANEVRRPPGGPGSRHPRSRVLITDMQPISPPIGGGRRRLLGLYGNLGDTWDATYVGSYDWPGEKFREVRLSSGLLEIDVPFSPQHFAAAETLNMAVPGRTIIDVATPWLIHHSPALVDLVRRRAERADVLVFSHPWMYFCARDIALEGGKPIVYDSQNCEVRLRESLLGDGEPVAAALIRGVREIEGRLCREARLILACTREDASAFAEEYGVHPSKIDVVPNGTDVDAVAPASTEQRARAKVALGLNGSVALFIGSRYPPNERAAAFIMKLAREMPQMTFVLAGGCADRLTKKELAGNVRVLGVVDETKLLQTLAAADMGLNPVETGSGMNIKILDYLAAGLPVVTTIAGARGVEGPRDGLLVESLEGFAGAIELLRTDAERSWRLGDAGRRLVLEQYNWRTISAGLGQRLATLAGEQRSSEPSPYFSVVVPHLERPGSLRRLMDRLEHQTYRNFEVVIVDQGPSDQDALRFEQWSFPLVRVTTHKIGAAHARNVGVRHASGRVVAFTDDDCEPSSDWLGKARPYFDTGVVGVEGRVSTDRTDRTEYRPVTNLGFEQKGFMTANLFLRRDVIESAGGFDERFDGPSFREDTDLAWRALSLGEIPFAAGVKVLHRAHRRDDARESVAERRRFFVKDPLLLEKHPTRYFDLAAIEGHHSATPGFWWHFFQGTRAYSKSLHPHGLEPHMSKGQWALFNELWALARNTPTLDLGSASILGFPDLPGAEDRGFLPATLSISEAAKHRAAELLDPVRQQLTAGDHTVAEYFDVSRDRYLATLGLVLDRITRGRVLDVGCSPGHVAMALYMGGFSVHGIDLGPEYVFKYPSEEWIERLHIRHTDLENAPIPFPDGFFECAVMTEVIEHVAINDPVGILAEIKRVLSPEGFLVLSTPNVANVSNALALVRGENVFWPPELFYGSLDRHNREYTPAELGELLARAGFPRREIGYVNTPANWNHQTASEVERLLAKREHSPDGTEPFWSNTILAVAQP